MKEYQKNFITANLIGWVWQSSRLFKFQHKELTGWGRGMSNLLLW